MYMTMLIVNIFEVKAKLSEYLDLVSKGERVMICRRNQPVAELRAVQTPRTEPRPVGGGKDRVRIPESFFEPLPAELLDAFDGATTTGPHSRVAEPGAAPSGSPRPRKRRTRR